MNSPQYTHGRVSPATFALRFLPLAEVLIDPANIGAPQAALRYELKSGVELAVYQCGVIVFDCQKWPPGTSVEIPSVLIEGGKRLPTSYTSADAKAYEHVVNRVQLTNCFLAAMSHSISSVQNTGLWLGQTADPSNYLPVALVERHPMSLNTNEVELLLRKLDKPRPPGATRITLQPETVRLACETLDEVLADGEATQVVDLYYKACYRYSQHDTALAATIAWTICEKSLNLLWKRHLAAIKVEMAEPKRMQGERMKKLLGRDFTASIVTETLELLGIINSELYAELNAARQVRNSWMHSLTGVGGREATQALTTAYKMIKKTYAVDIQVQLSQSTSY